MRSMPSRRTRQSPHRTPPPTEGETMMIKSSPKAFTRRRALKGLLNGAAVTVALPFLDCFLNNHGTALASGAPLPVRFGTWFWGLGFNPGRGVSKKTGQGIEFLEECQPLVPH